MDYADAAKRLVSKHLAPNVWYISPMPTDPTCIFCKIIAGEIPCHKIYEDQHVLSFLDIGPLSEGHALVIPKGHYQTIDLVPPDAAAALGRVLPLLSKAIMQATDSTDWNILQNNGEAAGQVVHHVHLHIIPRPAGDSRDEPTEGNGLPFGWPAGQADHDKTGKLAAHITEMLAK